MRLAVLHSTIREDEKLIYRAAEAQKFEVEYIDARNIVLNPEIRPNSFDVVLERCLSTTVGMHAVMFFQSLDIPVVNSYETAVLCDNKFHTSLVLKKRNIPTVPFVLAFNEKTAKEAVDILGGYPLILKPVSGSWGRLLAKVNDNDALEAVIEQKLMLGSPIHKAIYMQKYISKNGRDIRVTTIADRAICAIYREAEHWVTNTARGAKASVCQIDKAMTDICRKTSRAVGGGILGIDLFESGESYLVNEVNHTPEFKNVQRVTGVDVAGEMVKYCQTLIS